MADLIEADAAGLSDLEVEETGKPYTTFRDGELPFGIDNLRYFAGAARSLEGTGAGVLSAGYTSMLLRRPVGVIGAFAPWNFPFIMGIWKFAPAIAAGNTSAGGTERRLRGRVLVDVAVMLADGGEAIADIDVLRHQAPVLGRVASAPTVWRTLDEVTSARLKKIAAARARVGRHVWTQLAASPAASPASKVAGTDLGPTVVLDRDATIVVARSEKENAAPTFKKTFGFHPLGVWCDNTGYGPSEGARPWL